MILFKECTLLRIRKTPEEIEVELMYDDDEGFSAEAFVKALMQKETLDGSEIQRIVNGNSVELEKVVHKKMNGSTKNRRGAHLPLLFFYWGNQKKD